MLPSLLLLLSLLSPPGVAPGDLSGWTGHPLIAHALGGIEGKDYTNSREAFEQNYARGFRVFETDLLITTDDHLVARHDWGIKLYQDLRQDEYFSALPRIHYLSLEEFKALPILQKYHGMDWPEMLDLMVKHPDIYYVLDTKFTDEKTIRAQYRMIVEEAERIDPALLDRIIPQLYNRDMLPIVDSIHRFSSYIYTLYQSPDKERQVIDFCRSDSRIKAVAMPGGRATKSFIQSLNQIGVRSYVHTINDRSAFEKYRKMGVFGVYTDFIQYHDLVEGKKGSWTGNPPLPAD